MNKQVNEAILKIATKNKSVADLLINYNPENKSVIEEAKWRESEYWMSDKEIMQYYGEIWGNVKHMKSYIKELREKYKKEVNDE